MDTNSPGTVPDGSNGVPENGMPGGSQSGDAADLQALFEQRLNQSKEETFRGIQSILDRNISRLAQQNEARIAPLENQLRQLNGYFENASTANLSDEQRAERNLQQQLQDANNRANQNALLARIHGIHGQTLSTLASMGISYGDARINWDPMPDGQANLLQRDPDAWGRDILTQAALVIRAENGQQRSTQEQQENERTRAKQAAEAERARAQAINAQRENTPRLDTQTPGGGQVDWTIKRQGLTITQRHRLDDLIQKRAQAKRDKLGPGPDSGLTPAEMAEITASFRN